MYFGSCSFPPNSNSCLFDIQYNFVLQISLKIKQNKHLFTRKHANKNSVACFLILNQLLIINETGIPWYDNLKNIHIRYYNILLKTDITELEYCVFFKLI